MTARRPKANPDIVQLLEEYLVLAKAGQIDGVLIWASNGEDLEYQYCVHDVGDMCYDLGSIILLERSKA